jgi:hypothetical protein
MKLLIITTSALFIATGTILIVLVFKDALRQLKNQRRER